MVGRSLKDETSPILADEAAQLVDDPRLPDPRLADDEDCLTFPLRGEPPALLQRFARDRRAA